MSYKKTVTFTANVADFTDGTVTARVQAENSILNQLVTWILVNISGIQQLEKIEIGSEKWSGYPLYCVSSGAPSNVAVQVKNKWLLGSDCFILGKNKNNWDVGVFVDNHVLRFSPTCSFDFQDGLNAVSAKALSIVLNQMRVIYNESNRRTMGGTIEFITFNTTDTTLSVTLKYWKSAQNLIFAVNGKNDYVIFSNNENDANFGFFNETNNVNVLYSLNEAMQANASTQTNTASNASTGNYVENIDQNYQTSNNPIIWGNMGSQYSQSTYSSNADPYGLPIAMHKLSSNTEQAFNKSNPLSAYVTFSNLFVNFPRILSTQIYLRKVYTPNTANKAPIKMAYTPGYLTADSIYRVANTDYLCLANGWASYLIEVADQGE